MVSLCTGRWRFEIYLKKFLQRTSKAVKLEARSFKFDILAYQLVQGVGGQFTKFQ